MVSQSNILETWTLASICAERATDAALSALDHQTVFLMLTSFLLPFSSLLSLYVLFQAINGSWSSLWSPKRRVSNSSPPISSSTTAASCNRKCDRQRCLCDVWNFLRGLIWFAVIELVSFAAVVIHVVSNFTTPPTHTHTHTHTRLIQHFSSSLTSLLLKQPAQLLEFFTLKKWYWRS